LKGRSLEWGNFCADVEAVEVDPGGATDNGRVLPIVVLFSKSVRELDHVENRRVTHVKPLIADVGSVDDFRAVGRAVNIDDERLGRQLLCGDRLLREKDGSTRNEEKGEGDAVDLHGAPSRKQCGVVTKMRLEKNLPTDHDATFSLRLKSSHRARVVLSKRSILPTIELVLIKSAYEKLFISRGAPIGVENLVAVHDNRNIVRSSDR
jgi:hypothetical protein